METVIGPWQISIQRAWPTNYQLAGKYDAAAPGWHQRISHLGYVRAYAQFIKTIAAMGYLTHLATGSSVLDCGIGTAAFSLALAQNVPARVQIHGIDLSEAMVQQAEARLPHKGIAATIRSGDVCELPYPDHSFDAVLSAHMLEHLSNPAAGLREMVRVLRPGAPLLLSLTRPGLLGTILQWRWGNGTFQSEVIAQLLAGAGLTGIREISLTGGLSRFTSRAYVGVKG